MSSFINSTAGAVPVRNEKGEVVMQKVKVQRYVTGKAPAYAPQADSDESDDEAWQEARRRARYAAAAKKEAAAEYEEEEEIESRANDNHQKESMEQRSADSESDDEDELDPRLRRLREVKRATDQQPDEPKRRRLERHVESDAEDGEHNAEERANNVEIDAETRHERARRMHDAETRANDHLEASVVKRGLTTKADSDSESADDLNQQFDEEDEESESDPDEDDDGRPRLFKPVFVRKKDRVTIREHERDTEKRRKEKEAEAQQRAEERRMQTLQLIEESNRAEIEAKRAAQSAVHLVTAAGSLVPTTSDIMTASAKEDDDVRDRLAALDTDSENEEDETVAEQAYEEWKLRELRRVKRDREERERWQREKEEVERWRRMTEEERQEELRRNPKIVTNAQPKGKYNFLQKYFHRGAFFLDEDSELFKRDFTQQTLDDQCDRTKLPKVMQVKNFGRAGRTKWTHLVEEDTFGDMRNQLVNSTAAQKFHVAHAGGMKQVFDRPGSKKQKS